MMGEGSQTMPSDSLNECYRDFSPTIQGSQRVGSADYFFEVSKRRKRTALL
jgi:hypothetical protein